MDFAKKQLEKYGWTEGKGLGREENGLKEAIKPKPKCGVGGVGHSLSDDFTNNWWQRIYNKAADNIQINVQQDGEINNLSSKDEDTFNIDTRKFVKAKKTLSNKSYLQTFVKRATLKGNEMKEDEKKKLDETMNDDEEDKAATLKLVHLTDEALFNACGGRTAHKGARHGLMSSGKLSRLDEQEQELYSRMKRKRDEYAEKLLPVKKKVKSYDYTGRELTKRDELLIKNHGESNDAEDNNTHKSKKKKKKNK